MDYKLEMAPWAKKELRRQQRAEARGRFFCRVRLIFVVLLFATIFVFVHNHQVQVQSLAATGLHRLVKSKTESVLRQRALQHEKEVNQAAQ